MKTRKLFALALAMVMGTGLCYGLATECIGPDSERSHPTAVQPGWPVGMVDLARHESRVYSRWGNGSEWFYFQATPEQINELIHLFARMRVRDHTLRVKPGERQAGTFDGDAIDYNVILAYTDEFALAMSGHADSTSTNEPILTLHVAPGANSELWDTINLPDDITLDSDVPDCLWKSATSQPTRQVWYANVMFEDATPASAMQGRVQTAVTLWEKDVEEGIKLGRANLKGEWHAAFSKQEIEALKTGESWLTLTVGNWSTEAKRDHPRLSVESLALDKESAQAVEVSKPNFYYGRILFRDGSPAVFPQETRPGQRIEVLFDSVGSAEVDSEGYFAVCLTGDQYEKLTAKKTRKNVFVPNQEKSGHATALYAFPASKLSQDKEKAGVVEIRK